MFRPRSESTVRQLAFARASCASSPWPPPRRRPFPEDGERGFGALVRSCCTETNARSSGRSYPRAPPCQPNAGCARRAADPGGCAVILPLAAPGGNEPAVGAIPLEGSYGYAGGAGLPATSAPASAVSVSCSATELARP